jgi:type II secretory pathway component GspD/PulD (secretin)
MIVHPTVSTFIGYEESYDGDQLMVRYPVIDIREAETQILLKTGETGVIGGLLQDRVKGGIQKIPVLGSIPMIGRFFRNETADNQTIDLLIFVTATIVTPENRNAIIGETGKSGTTPPVTITVPAAAVEIPAAPVEVPAAPAVEKPVAVKPPETAEAAPVFAPIPAG